NGEGRQQFEQFVPDKLQHSPTSLRVCATHPPALVLLERWVPLNQLPIVRRRLGTKRGQQRVRGRGVGGRDGLRPDDTVDHHVPPAHSMQGALQHYVGTPWPDIDAKVEHLNRDVGRCESPIAVCVPPVPAIYLDSLLP